MSLPLSPTIATQVVLWGGLLAGIVLGAVAQATRFCTMGALADWFSAAALVDHRPLGLPARAPGDAGAAVDGHRIAPTRGADLRCADGAEPSLSLLSAGSCLALAGIVAGTGSALQWQTWRLGDG